MLGGCAGKPISDSATTTGSETLFFGQITAIDGSNITLAVGQQPKLPQLNKQQNGTDATAPTTGNGDETGKPQGGAPQSGDTSLGDDNAPNGNTPNDSTSQGDDNAPKGTPPADGNAPDNMGKGPGSITLTGEEQTITVSDDTVMTIQNGKNTKTCSLTDLKTDDIVTVVVTDGKVTSVTVMQFNGPQSSDAASSNGSVNKNGESAK